MATLIRSAKSSVIDVVMGSHSVPQHRRYPARKPLATVGTLLGIQKHSLSMLQ